MPDPANIDRLLGAALRGEDVAWAENVKPEDLAERARYHGVSALLLPRVADRWPDALISSIRAEARRRAIWEVQHRDLIDRLLCELGARGGRALFLKGTALAYSVYDAPETRSRADSDLLVRSDELEIARESLAAVGFSRPDPTAGDAFEENWAAHTGDMVHIVDLHRVPFNSTFLAPILTTEEAFANAVPLPPLGDAALRLDGPHGLLHVCVHRNMHRTAPYFSGGKMMISADRLIWAVDIERLAASFSAADWETFVDLARRKELTRAMLEALDFAERGAGAVVPDFVRTGLQRSGKPERRSNYMLESGRRSRALANLLSDSESRPWQRLKLLLSPSDSSLRARYPLMANAPRILLLARRMIDFVTARGR